MKIEIDKHVLINVIFMVLKPLGFFVLLLLFFLKFRIFFLCIAPIKKTKDRKCIKCDTWLISLIFFCFRVMHGSLQYLLPWRFHHTLLLINQNHILISPLTWSKYIKREYVWRAYLMSIYFSNLSVKAKL